MFHVKRFPQIFPQCAKRLKPIYKLLLHVRANLTKKIRTLKPFCAASPRTGSTHLLKHSMPKSKLRLIAPPAAIAANTCTLLPSRPNCLHLLHTRNSPLRSSKPNFLPHTKRLFISAQPLALCCSPITTVASMNSVHSVAALSQTSPHHTSNTAFTRSWKNIRFAQLSST